MKQFQQNSYWDQPTLGEEVPLQPVHATFPRPKANSISSDQLQDWADRLRTMADEAGDTDLFALESNILDLRDEIVEALTTT